MWIGAHVSIAKGLLEAVRMVVEMKGNTFQFFSRNPRGGKARALNVEEIREAHNLMEAKDFGVVVAHAPYTCNLASAKKGVREFSRLTIGDDLLRIKEMGVPYLVVHVGSHVGQGEEKGLALVVEGLRELLLNIPAGTMLLLEGMAGQGTELGYDFAHFTEIMTACENHPGLGICLDSCHLTGAGYDLAQWSKVKAEFDQAVGWDKLKVFHLNDSLHPLGSRKDRHAKLGEGYVGLATLGKIVKDRDLQNIPVILETPNDNNGYAQEIAMIREIVC